jgi:Family of unknown function (DUF6152)
MKRVLGCCAVLFAACATAAWAHHSYGMFDMQKVVEVRGTVKEFRYLNPHSWILLKVQDASGTTSDAMIEANGPGYLVKLGWKRNSLTTGDVIVASINPLRDGAAGGNLVKLTLPDGRELKARPDFPQGPPPERK